MKKVRGIIAVLGTAVLMAGAVGCGGGSKESSAAESMSVAIETKAAASTAEESAAETTAAAAKTTAAETTAGATTVAETTATSSSGITLEHQLLLEKDGIKITAQEWVTDEFWGNGIKLLVENDTDKKVSVSTNALIVNNYMVTDTFVADVAAGKKTNEVMYLDSDELEAAGVDNIGQIEIYFCAYDSESYDTLWDADVVTLQTSAYAQMDMTADEEKEGLELFNEAGIRVVGMAVDENSYWGKSILFYIENTSDKNVYVSVEDLSINGYMIEPYYSQMLYAGKKAVSAMDLLQNDLDANNIKSIDEVELKFQVYDAVTFDDIVVSDPISFATE